MNCRKNLITILLFILLFSVIAQDVNASYFSNVRNYFSQIGKEAPEFQCIVNIDTEISEECLAYFIEYKLGHTCQVYTKYDKKKGIKQCDFCVNRFLYKTSKNIPKSCLDVKIDGTHFTEQEMKDLVNQNKDKLDPEINNNKLGINQNNINELAYAEDGIEIGRVTFVQGQAFIERKTRIFRAYVGEELICNDILSVDKNSELIIQLNSKEVKIDPGTRFSLPTCKDRYTSKIGSFFGNMWNKVKEKLSGDSFEVKTPTATAGVRG